MIKKISLTVSGIHCSSCTKIILMELADLDGIIKSEFASDGTTLVVDFNDEHISGDQIIQTIKNLGYSSKLK